MLTFLKKILFRQKIAAQSICCICNKQFADSEMVTIDTLALCPPDSNLYKNSTWELTKELRSDPTDPDNALHIQELKDQLASQGKPSYIKSDYSQDSEDHIITTFQLFSLSK